MKLYEKILQIRNRNEVKMIRKEGKGGPGKGYPYFESQKVVSVISDMCFEYNLFTFFTFNEKEVILNIINLDDTDEILEIRSFMPEILPMNKGANGLIQGVGSYHTYMKRYMFMDLFDICERDIEIFEQEDSEEHQTLPEEPQEDKEEDQDKVYRTAGDVIAYATRLSKDNKAGNILKVMNTLHAPLDLKQQAREMLLQNSSMINKYDTKLTAAQIFTIIKERIALDKLEKRPSVAIEVLNRYNKAGLCDDETCRKVAQYVMGLKLNDEGEFL